MDLTALLLLEIALIFASKKKPKKIERLPANPNFWARAPFEPISYLATTSSKTLRCRPSFLPSFLPSSLSSCCQPSTASSHVQCSLPDLNREPPCPVFPAGPQPQPSGPQPRPFALSVPCRASTATICAESVFPAGPQPRPSALSVPAGPQPRPSALSQCMFPAGPEPRPSALSVSCRASTATICAQCSLPDLNHDHLRSVSLPGLNHDHLRSVSACSLPDLNRDHRRSVFPAGPEPRPSALSVSCQTSTAR